MEDNKFITVLTFTYAHEVAIIRGRLEAEGITCFTKDEFDLLKFWKKKVILYNRNCFVHSLLCFMSSEDSTLSQILAIPSSSI